MDVLSASSLTTRSPGTRTTAARTSPRTSSPRRPTEPSRSLRRTSTATATWTCSPRRPATTRSPGTRTTAARSSRQRHHLHRGRWCADSVFAADVDGDGDMDVLSASSNRRQDRLVRERRQPELHTARSPRRPTGPIRICGGRGRGRRHGRALRVGIRRQDRLVREQRQPELHQRTIISTSADSAESVFAADVDGDGDMDVLSAS